MYKHLLKPILFRFNPEKAHNILFGALKVLRNIPFAEAIIRLIYKRNSPSLEREVFGIKFPNPVGLAGGLDKNGEFYNQMGDFGFGFVEIGSLTPLPQDGNPSPRCFRVVQDRAIINRFGINNKGVMNAIEHLKKDKPQVIVAGNISKNSKSTNEDAAKDYEKTFSLLYDFVDMFVVNISCPNVVGLTNLQDISYLSDIFDRLLELRAYYDEYKPILVKLSPDIPFEQVDQILEYALTSGIDGVVAGNTTRSREGLTISQEEIEKIGNGGLSGAPLYHKNLALVKHINQKTNGALPIIGVGGIMSPEQAKEVLDAGASLVEIYSGFIYEGPALIKRIIKHLEKSQCTQN